MGVSYVMLQTTLRCCRIFNIWKKNQLLTAFRPSNLKKPSILLMQNDKLNFVFLFYNKNFISNNKQNGNFRLAAFFVKCRDSLISFFNSNCGIQFCLATKQQKMQNFRLASFFCKTSDFKMISFCRLQFCLWSTK